MHEINFVKLDSHLHLKQFLQGMQADPQRETFQVPQLEAVLESEAFLQQSNELKKDMVKVAHTNQHHLKNHSKDRGLKTSTAKCNRLPLTTEQGPEVV